MLEIVRPPWWDRAACRGKGLAVFFPDDPKAPGAYDAAIEICSACPVRELCLEEFIAEPFGMWGGLSPTERSALRRARREAS